MLFHQEFALQTLIFLFELGNPFGIG
jgi:hypothetical protein